MTNNETQWFRVCPACKGVLYYSSKWSLRVAQKNENKCHGCKNLGIKRSLNAKKIMSIAQKKYYKANKQYNFGTGIKYTIECKACNKPFETRRKEAQYCSYECYWNSNDKLLKEKQRKVAEGNLAKYSKQHGSWNKGLTKENNKSLERVSEHHKNWKGNPFRIAWNKGKTGIYSEETIEKIRQGVAKQYKEGRTKKVNTKPERNFKLKLNEFKINYEQSYYLCKKIYDFYLPKYNILIEIDGIYWHGKDLKDIELNETQSKNRKNDKLKNKIAKENNMKLLRFWEGEILSLTKGDIVCYV